MPVIAQVDWSPKAGVQTHWIVIYGKENGRYLMKDPYRYGGDSPEKKLYLTDRYDHQGKKPAQAITGVVWYEGRAQGGGRGGAAVEKLKKVEVPANTFTAFVLEDGLAMRNAPSVAGSLLKRLPLSVELTSLEPDAEGKVGTQDEWLHVQEPEGDQGYVAAWYLVSSKKDIVAKAAEKVSVPSDTFTVYGTAEGLAFRSQPTIAGTLLKRLPLYAEFSSLEPSSTGRDKVGDHSQWLHVQDPDGVQGYVAAWYLTLSKEEEEAKAAETKMGDRSFIVRPTTSGLAFRTEMVVAANTLIKRLPAGASLIVIEPLEQAKKKIGVQGQWLKVKEASGQEGYVAAWYVTPGKEPALGVRVEEKSAKATPDDDLVVRTTVDALALRRSPQVAAGTLIKRLPQAAELMVLEEDAEDQIGVSGEWLRVRDLEGDIGYVAAWYVVRR